MHGSFQKVKFSYQDCQFRFQKLKEITNDYVIEKIQKMCMYLVEKKLLTLKVKYHDDIINYGS